MIVYFDPEPPAAPLAVAPASFASPFDPGEPRPLARRAADELIDWLGGPAGRAALPGPDGVAGLDAPGGGKMFGVLVVAAPDGRIGYLRGFSGMLAGAWHVPGFVPPLFDPAARDAFWPDGQRRLAELDRALRELAASPDGAAARAEHASLAARHAAERTALDAVHRERRAARHAARAAIRARRLTGDAAASHAIDQASRGDTAEHRRMVAAQAAARAVPTARLAALDAAVAALERERAEQSRALMTQVHDSYVIASARGERRPLRALFAPGEPPGGAGDCAGPKLIGHAHRL
ncbi:MAG TPA: hypothetical protein VK607_22025, partial [Kofleriaceae bacterium]|nr:hypothetical protein [Kofleriaceae bacterium]